MSAVKFVVVPTFKGMQPKSNRYSLICYSTESSGLASLFPEENCCVVVDVAVLYFCSFNFKCTG